jgi:hypothetical protein
MTIESSAGSGSASDLDLFETEATGKPASVAKVATIPDKYTGKTVEDLISMHQNAERLISRQGEEVAQVRRIADEILQLKKPTTQTTQERKPVTVDALLNDPEAAIKSAVQGSDLVRRTEAAEARVASLESQITEGQFTAKHKNVAQDINDPVFLEWVNKNQTRQTLAAHAAQKNFKAASELWDMWEEHKELTGAVRKDPTTDNTKGAKTVPTTVRSSPLDAISSGKPVYSRAKLMVLREKVAQGDPASITRWNDPTFQKNMHEAYAEKRVK